MPPPFAYFSPPKAPPDLPDKPDAPPEIKAERQYNALLTAIEQNGAEEIRSALREQQLALLAKLDSLGDVDEGRIVANTMRVLTANADPLQAAIYRVLVTASRAGVTAVSQALPFNMAVGVDWTLSNANAEQFALNYSYDLVSRVQQTTRKGIGQAVARWVREGGRLEDLTESIRPLITSEPSTKIIESLFSVDRAMMIAETEATRAYAEGKVNGYVTSGLAQIAPERIPPAHVRCRCDVRPEKDADGSWWWIWLTANDSISQDCDVCGPLHLQRVGLARPAPLPESKALALAHVPIANIEQSFLGRSKQSIAVYGADGRLLHTDTGTARQVRVKAENAELTGATILHNHPGGLSFSAGDVQAVHAQRVAELRVVGINSRGKAWRHIIKPNAAFFQMEWRTLAGIGEAAHRKVTAEMLLKVLDGTLTREQAHNDFHHRLWVEFAARLKANGRARLGYRREAFYG